MRTGFGTFTNFIEEQKYSRDAFWWTIFSDEAFKIILKDLAGRPLQTYQEARSSNFANPIAVREFQNALRVWQKQYNLETEWIAQNASHFLKDWAMFPPMLRRLEISTSTSYVDSIRPTPPGLNEYRPCDQTPESYAQEMKSAARMELDSSKILSVGHAVDKRKLIEGIRKKALAYAEGIANDMRTVDPSLTLAKNLPKRGVYLTWLIRNYCFQEKMDAIAKVAGVTAALVSREIKALAALLDLPTPKHVKRGRPLGSTNLH